MRVPVIVQLTGMLLRLFGVMFLPAAGVALFYGERDDALTFVLSGLFSSLVGHLMTLVGHRKVDDLRRLEALTVVSASWVLLAHAAAVPYVAAGMPPIDALFEAMSGLTTTGATAMRDFAEFGRGIFFWRALTHWLGGMGVIALFVAVLPRLGIGGRQLFFAEAPGPTDEKLTPQIRKTAAALWSVYAGLTAAQVVTGRGQGKGVLKPGSARLKIGS